MILACYDGKWGRFVTAAEVARRGCFRQYEFSEWGTVRGERTRKRMWIGPRSRGGFLKVRGWSLHKAFGNPGDWYSIVDTDSVPRKYWHPGWVTADAARKAEK